MSCNDRYGPEARYAVAAEEQSPTAKWEAEVARGLAVGGFIDVEPEETVVQIRKLKRLAAERGYRLVPGHDPVAWPGLTRELSIRWPAAASR